MELVVSVSNRLDVDPIFIERPAELTLVLNFSGQAAGNGCFSTIGHETRYKDIAGTPTIVRARVRAPALAVEQPERDPRSEAAVHAIVNGANPSIYLR